MKKRFISKVLALLSILVITVVTSCKKDDEVLSSSDSSNASSESAADAYYEDSDGLSLQAAADAFSGTRVQTDDRLCDGKSQVTSAKPTSTTATVDIVFNKDNEETGCEDPRHNVRKGKIHLDISVTGNVGNFVTTTVITFTNYSVNGIKIEGTRTIVNKPSGIADLTLDGGIVTWPDGTKITREATFTRKSESGTITITGNASGTTRAGKPYTMAIENDLIYKTTCAASTQIYLPVQGVKKFTNTDSKASFKVDYGTGDCDKIVSILVGNLSFNYTLTW